MKKFISVVIVAFAAILFGTTTRGAISIEITPILGPLKTSPNWPTFVSAMRAGNFSVYPHVDHVEASYLSAPTAGSGVKMWLGNTNPPAPYNSEGGNTLWFMVYVNGNGTKFVPHFQVLQTSSQNNLFGKNELIGGSSLEYNGTSWAVIRNDNSTSTIVENGMWNQAPVSEFWFIGTAAKTMNANDAATVASNATWFNANVHHLQVVYTLIGPSGPLAGEELILERMAPPPATPPNITITRGVNKVTVKATGMGSRTGKFQSSVGGGVWMDIGNASEGALLDVATTSPDLSLFRVKVN